MTLTRVIASVFLSTAPKAQSLIAPKAQRLRRALMVAVVGACVLGMNVAGFNTAHAVEIPSDIRIDVGGIVVSKEELVCLALNDYWEARSEEIAGRIAVARVVLNRAMDSRFPSNLCDVIKQSKVSGNAQRCQFSWVCEQKPDPAVESREWRDSLKIAAAVLQKDSAIPDPTGGALWYHADFTRPAWAVGFESTTIIGTHVFYREPDDPRSPPAQRKPFIYRLNAFAEFVGRRKAKVTTLAMAREASPVAVKDGAVAAQPVAR